MKRWVLPVSAFLIAWGVHYLWLSFSTAEIAIQTQWVSFDPPPLSAWQRYFSTQAYFISYAYSLSFAFAVISFRRYRENQICSRTTLGITGLGLSGLSSLGACFFAGCCGSPMLSVYLSFLGTKFLPFAKPLVALLTTVMVGGAWYWSRVKRRLAIATTSENCNCN